MKQTIPEAQRLGGAAPSPMTYPSESSNCVRVYRERGDVFAAFW